MPKVNQFKTQIMLHQITALDLKAFKKADAVVFRVLNCKHDGLRWQGESFIECQVDQKDDPWNRTLLYKAPCDFTLQANDYSCEVRSMAKNYHIKDGNIACVLNAWPRLGDSQWTTITRALRSGDQLNMLFDVDVLVDGTIRNSLRLTSIRTATKKWQKSEWLIDVDRRPFNSGAYMMVPFVKTEYAIAL